MPGSSPVTSAPNSLITIFQNCDCCGSGSSGSGSGSFCWCKYYDADFDVYRGFFSSCSGSPVWDECKTEFVATVRLNFSGCGSSPFGSCSTGSSGSSTGGGPSTGGDFEPTGSASGSESCNTSCPDCCDFFPNPITFSLTCKCVNTAGISNYKQNTCFLMSTNLIDPSGPCLFEGSLNYGSGSCFGYRSDKCPYFIISDNSLEFNTGGIGSVIFIPFDDTGAGMYGEIRNAAITSCDPVLISGDIVFWPWPNPAFSPCFSQCTYPGYAGGLLAPTCITGTFTITEA